jgi:vancomycin resistance protein YoaR
VRRATRKRRSRSRRILAGTAGALIAALLIVLVRDSGQIYPNVHVAGVEVGGMERHIVRASAWTGGAHPAMPPPQTPVVVRAGDASCRCRLEETGVSFDLERALDRAYAVGRTGPALEQFLDRLAAYARRTDIAIPAVVNEKRASAFARDCAGRFNRRPENASVDVDGATARVIPGKRGIEIGVAEVPAAIRRWAAAGCHGDLQLSAHLTGALVTAEQLRAVDTVLASVRTSLSGSSRNRRHNVALAAAAVNGCVLMPSETFSYNRVVGPRTEETGYRTAPIIRNGKLVPGTGGGACQLSSTLYQAALRAGLEIIARSHHSQPVAYTPAGLDATVVYPIIDLKFRNPSQHPMVLGARIRDRRLECRVLGPDPAPKIELTRRVRWISPPGPRVVEDAGMPPGKRVVEVKARRGVRVEVYRRQGGAAADRGELISTDYYAPEAALIRQGSAAATAPIETKGSPDGDAGTPDTAPKAHPDGPSESLPSPRESPGESPKGSENST